MGNSMCKSQPPNGRSRNSLEEFFAGCSNFCSCPSGISSHRNYHWKKQVIETRPPYLGAHTTSTKWHQATTLTSTQPLKQRHDMIGNKPPVPPPRKKRLLQKARSYEDVVDVRVCKKDGFKDVFGNLDRQTTSTSHSHIYDLEHPRNKPELEDDDDDMEKCKSLNFKSIHIGNKKSDKFFGENLSDSLSNEPYFPEEESILTRKQDDNEGNEKDALDMFVEKNVQKVEKTKTEVDKTDNEDRLSENLDKKAAFLMTMLDNYNDKKAKNDEDDDERYRGMVPVEEEIIVPKKKITRCICDETDHLLHHLRHDECKSHEELHNHKKDHHTNAELVEKVDKKDVATETPPLKPKRDLTLYRKSLELSESVPVLIEKTPSPPSRRKKSMSNSREELNATNLSLSSSNVSKANENPSPERSESPNSILTKDLVNQLVNHAFPHYMDIEDIQHNVMDGSAAVSERMSKLKERKISLNRKISTDSSHSNQTNMSNEIPNSPGPFTSTEKLSLGFRDVTISPLSFKEEPVRVDAMSTRMSVSPEKEEKKSVTPDKEEKKRVTPEKEENVSIETKKLSSVQEKEEQPSQGATHKIIENQRKEERIPANLLLDEDGANFIEELIRHQHFNSTEDVINEIYKNQGNIVHEFHRFLEDELNKEENIAKLNAVKKSPEIEIKEETKITPIIKLEESIEDQSIDLVSNSASSETSSEASTIKNLSDSEDHYTLRRDSVNELETWFSPHNPDFPSIAETHMDLVSSSGSSCSDNASTIRAMSISDAEDEGEIPELLYNNHLNKAKEAHSIDNRRESIEDVDIWFTQHLDLPHTDLSQSLVNEDAKKADFLSYDAVKLYPFGQPRERHLSLTDEFFNSHESKDQKSVKRSNSEPESN
uniref:CSON005847 protein n=1 Tax=Culicoides sonorensis TaxID=179676 RepID=A0A336LYD0_CULSO